VAIGTKRAGQNQIEVWSRAAKKMTASVPTPDSGVLLAVTPDGRFVILSTRPGSESSIRDEMQVYDMAAKVIVSRSALDVRDAVVTPTGQHLIASLQEGENVMDVWELGQEGGAGLAIGHEGKVIAVGLAPPGVLATIGENGEKLIIRAWDVRTRLEMPERRAEVTGTGAVFAPDDQSFAVMGDGGVEVRRVDQPEPVAKFAYAKPANVVWSPDGRYLAAQKDRDVVVWDLRTRQAIGQLALPEPPISLALTTGGDSLAAVFSAGVSRAGERHYGKLWKVANGEVLKSFEPSTGENYWEMLNLTDILDEVKTSSALSAVADKTGKAQDDHPVAHDQESRYLVTINDRNTVRVWLLRQDDLIEEACRRLPRNLSEGEWREYVGDAAYRKTCPELP
jgi:WD40 repeat protein